jgi:hypothetical protein
MGLWWDAVSGYPDQGRSVCHLFLIVLWLRRWFDMVSGFWVWSAGWRVVTEFGQCFVIRPWDVFVWLRCVRRCERVGRALGGITMGGRGVVRHGGGGFAVWGFSGTLPVCGHSVVLSL